MSKRKDGGPAFPGGESYYTTDVMGCRTDHDKAPLHRGMSLRDWFAGQALRGLLSEVGRPGVPSPVDWPSDSFDVTARLAYHFADAMLAAREEVRS